MKKNKMIMDEELDEKAISKSNKKKAKKDKKKLKKEAKEEHIEQLEIDDKKEEELSKTIIKKKTKIRFDNLIKYATIIMIPILLIMIGYYIMAPKINLKGKEVVEISYTDIYKEKGATAKSFGRDITNKMKISGKVKDKKVGEYTIKYSVKSMLITSQKERIVKVVDKVKPTIELTGEKKKNVCPKKEYEEEGFKATDEYDGDLTKKVKVTKNKDKTKVTYTVEDSSKNKAKVTRELTYEDKENPIITLKGSTTFYVMVNQSYNEPGYTAEDNCAGDLTEKVKVEGTVNTAAAGTYMIKYSVKDDAGNEAVVERKVVVTNSVDPNSGESKPGVIYLTFDDGPQDGTTNVILDILKEEGVKATFFVTGYGPDELIKREYDEGHTVALHTMVHDYAVVYASGEAYFNDLKQVHDRVQRITGQDSRIIRFPGGASNTISRNYCSGIMTYLTQEVLNRGYRYYDWNISSGDAGSTKDPNQVYANVVNSFSKSRPNMVLMHDIKWYTRDALRNIIRFGKENGYTFEPITMDTAMIRQRVGN